VTAIACGRKIECAVTNEREAVQFICLLLYYGGALNSYSKGNKPCDVEITSSGLQAKFHCWFIKKQNDSGVSFQIESFFVKRVSLCYKLYN
jgi:hypothetical protein